MGTGSAAPVVGRIQSAHVLDVHGRSFLIDCGEGVQRAMLRGHVSLLKVDNILLSHIHGDHIFGFFGLMSTIGMKGRQAPIDVYAPSNFGPMLKFFMSYYGQGIPFEVRFHPVDPKGPEKIIDTRTIEVLAFPLNHKIATNGYIIREKRPLLDVRKEALEKYGLTLSEIGTLKRGEDVIRPAGQDEEEVTFMNGFVRHSGTDKPLKISVEEAAYVPFVPRSYAYVSDTAPFPELAGWVRGVDILYHESTYLEALADQALQRFHSTARQAASCAAEAGVGKLGLGHYSSRCQDEKLYQAEAREIFPESYAANDGDVFDLPLLKNGE